MRVLVSSGPAGLAELEVPDVRGEDEQAAVETLEAEGFRVDVIRTGDGTTVEDQQPSGRPARMARRRRHAVRRS